MDRYWEHGVLNLAIYPFPVFEIFQTSSIVRGALHTRIDSNDDEDALQAGPSRRTKAHMGQAHFFGNDATRALRRNLQGRFT